MDASLYRAVNRLAARTGWAHPLFIAYAKYGVVLFAGLLLAGWWLARRSADIDAVAAVVWAGAAAVLALGIGQLIGHAVDRARPCDCWSPPAKPDPWPCRDRLIASFGRASFSKGSTVRSGSSAD